MDARKCGQRHETEAQTSLDLSLELACQHSLVLHSRNYRHAGGMGADGCCMAKVQHACSVTCLAQVSLSETCLHDLKFLCCMAKIIELVEAYLRNCFQSCGGMLDILAMCRSAVADC